MSECSDWQSRISGLRIVCEHLSIRLTMETLKDLLEEAKRRTILVAILVLIVAYVMSLTSSSVWINLPVSILVLAALRRLSFEVEFRWRPRINQSRPQYALHQHRRQLTNYDPLLSGLPTHVAATRWRRQIDSLVVEKAVDELTRCVIDEFITSLWYSSITPDQEAPEELRILLNGVIAEVAHRAKRVDLVTLLSRDVVELVGTHFELYRQMKSKIGPDIIASLSIEERDEKLKFAMMTSRKLHPALVSDEAEYKVLKKLTGGIVALVLKRQDSHCRLLRTLARELLACAVLRPVLNFATPGYINELIESLVIASTEKERQGSEKASGPTQQRVSDPTSQKRTSVSGHETIGLSRLPRSPKQVVSEINPLKKKKKHVKAIGDVEGSTQSQPPYAIKPVKEAKGTEQFIPDTMKEVGPPPPGSGPQALDAVTQRRVQALAPEHLDNLWTKGRDYKKREIETITTPAMPVPAGIKDPATNSLAPIPVEVDISSEVLSGQEMCMNEELNSKDTVASPIRMEVDDYHLDASALPIKDKNVIESNGALLFGDSKEGDKLLPGIGFSTLGTPHPNFQSMGNPNNVTDGSSPRGPEFERLGTNEDLDSSSRISQPKAETSGQSPRSRHHYRPGLSSQRLRKAVKILSHRKTKSSGGILDGWNGLEGGSSQGLTPLVNAEDTSPARSSASESYGRWRSSRKSPMPDPSRPPVHADVDAIVMQTPLSMLHCRVLVAHFEKIGSRTFAVYIIQVKDTENRTWQIQRRFRNFEQLHRRLKDMPYYNLTLPPKRFLSSSLDSTFVRERCTLLDKYLKDLLAIPSVAELHEVWDFLSLNSQHYTHDNSVSMIKTLAVNVDDAVDDMVRQIRGVSDDISGVIKTATTGIRQRLPTSCADMSDAVAFEDTRELTYGNFASRLHAPLTTPDLTDGELSEKPTGASVSGDEYGGAFGANVPGLGSLGWQSDSDVHLDSSDTEALKTGPLPFFSGLDNRFLGSRLEGTFSDGHSPVESYASETVADDLVIPQEWYPPKVSVPLLNLVDLIFQLQGRGWIRRQVLWIAKQILQLGMGDAIDDWLLGRIQWLRREEVVASGIQWVREILWPDGIFVTKHPRNLPAASAAILESTGHEVVEAGYEWQQRPPTNCFEYRLEAARRASIVRETILEKAPTPLVSLIGKKQYTRCAKDIYYFSQSTVCVKQLTYGLLEMLLVQTFPELHDLILNVRSSVT